MNQREKDLKCDNIVNIESQTGLCGLICPEEPNSIPKNFTFDGAYGIDSNTETIYNDVGFPLVESVSLKISCVFEAFILKFLK
jgi:hypothetical protein